MVTLKNARILLVASLLISGYSLSAVKKQSAKPKQPSTHNSKAEQFYKKGYKVGLSIVQALEKATTPFEAQKAAQSGSLTGDKDIVALQLVLNAQKPETEEYKAAFSHMQQVSKGLKDALLTYTPSGNTDQVSVGKDDAIKISLEVADITIQSRNHMEVAQEMGQFLSSMAREIQQALPAKQKVTIPKVDSAHPSFKKGYETGKETCDSIVKRAQGKKVSAVKLAALNKKAADYLNSEQKSAENQLEYSCQWLNGFSKALKELNIEALLKEHATPQKTADKLRLEYKVARRLATSINRSQGNPANMMDKLGKTLENYGAASERLAQK